jgi:hypothetical protein
MIAHFVAYLGNATDPSALCWLAQLHRRMDKLIARYALRARRFIHSHDFQLLLL